MCPLDRLRSVGLGTHAFASRQSTGSSTKNLRPPTRTFPLPKSKLCSIYVLRHCEENTRCPKPVETAAPAGLRANLFGPSIVVVTMVGSTTVFVHWPSRRLRAPLARGRKSQGGRRGVVSRLRLRPREPIASGSGPLRMLVVGRGTPSWSCIFLIWSAGKPLKRPESDEGIQENPKPFSWSGLAWIWFGLEEFGLRRSARRRRLLAPNAPSGWAKPVALDGNQTTVEGDQTGSTRSFKNPPAANPIEVSFRWGGGGRAAAFGEVK